MSDWFNKLRSSSGGANLRLFLLHYAGGSATVFKGWEKYFGADIDVFAIQMPGRDMRFREAPLTDLPKVLEHLVEEITPYMDLPCVFFGHSMGALIAYELVRKLESKYSEKVVHLVLSALRAPHLPNIRAPIYNLPYEEMIEVLKDFSSGADEIFDNREAMQEFMPMLRADFSICDTYEYNPIPKLASRVTLFSGKEDFDSPIKDTPAWQSLCVQPVSYFEFDGGHFFVNEYESECLNILRNIIVKELEGYSSKFEIIL